MNTITPGTPQIGEPDNVPEWDERRVALALERLARTLPTLIGDLVGVYLHFHAADQDRPVCWRCETGVPR